MALFFPKQNFSSILEDMWQGYTLEETKQMISNYEMKGFSKYLLEHNMTTDEALTIYQYSVNSNMMLGLARKTATKESIKENFFKEMKDGLKLTIKENRIDSVYEKIKGFVENLDFSKPIHMLKKEARDFAKNEGIIHNPISNTIENIAHLRSAETTMKDLDKILDKYTLQKDMVLYRAVNSSYLPKKPEEMVGETIVNESATSTTYDKGGGFIDNKEMDLVYQIKVPAGTKGLNIEQLSGYKREKEVLLAGHQLKVNDYHYDGEKIYLECDLVPLEKNLTKNVENIDSISLDTPLENQGKQKVYTNQNTIEKSNISIDLE